MKYLPGLLIMGAFGCAEAAIGSSAMTTSEKWASTAFLLAISGYLSGLVLVFGGDL